MINRRVCSAELNSVLLDGVKSVVYRGSGRVKTEECKDHRLIL